MDTTVSSASFGSSESEFYGIAALGLVVIGVFVCIIYHGYCSGIRRRRNVNQTLPLASQSGTTQSEVCS